MPKVKKVDEVTALAGRLIEALESLRTRGGGAYPPTLRALAEEAGASTEDGRVLKAVGKKAFTEQATAKATGRVEPDSPVYFKADVPTKAELLRVAAEALAGRMLRVLESQRPLGDGAYPPTLRRLAELSGTKGSDKAVAQAVALEPMAAGAVVANAGKPSPDAPVFLRRDLGPGGADLVPALLGFAFAKSRKPKARTFTPPQLAKALQKPIQDAFLKALRARIEAADLPAEYAWVVNKDPLLFRLDDLMPGLPRMPASPGPAPAEAGPARDFAPAFREAFERVDRHNGMTNFVKLVDLRRELADFGRGAFDAGLRRLRVDREFSLDSHEGLFRPLTPEEREAGVAEAGSLLVYVSRR